MAQDLPLSFAVTIIKGQTTRLIGHGGVLKDSSFNTDLKFQLGVLKTHVTSKEQHEIPFRSAHIGSRMRLSSLMRDRTESPRQNRCSRLAICRCSPRNFYMKVFFPTNDQ